MLNYKELCATLSLIATIYKLQQEKYYMNQYNKFVHNLDFVRVF